MLILKSRITSHYLDIGDIHPVRKWVRWAKAREVATVRYVVGASRGLNYLSTLSGSYCHMPLVCVNGYQSMPDGESLSPTSPPKSFSGDGPTKLMSLHCIATCNSTSPWRYYTLCDSLRTFPDLIEVALAKSYMELEAPRLRELRARYPPGSLFSLLK